MFRLMLTGCLSFILGGLVVGTGCVVVTRETMDASTRAQTLARAEARRLDRAHRFTPPADGALDPDGFARFLRARERLLKTPLPAPPTIAAGNALSPVETLRTQLDSRLKGRVQAAIKSLESDRVGPAEYRWYARAAYGSLLGGAAAEEGDGVVKRAQTTMAGAATGLSKLMGDVQLEELIKTPVKLSSASQDLVKQHRAQLLDEEAVAQDVAILALLGASGSAE